MDPLDQRLTDAGTSWRQSQPEPPTLDPMIVALRQRQSGLFPRRLMYAFVAALLLLAAVAAAPGVGSFLQHSSTLPVVTATQSPTPSHTATSPTATPASTTSPTATSDRDTAAQLVDRYEAALVASRWSVAFDLLAPTTLTHQAGLSSFTSERRAFFVSVAGRYTLGAPTRVNDWTSYAPVVSGADRSRAYLIEVDYPALSNNNAGYEQFVVAPDSSGTWRIWPVR
jgi:hypothetical protein